jgi:hypothetical protein
VPVRILIVFVAELKLYGIRVGGAVFAELLRILEERPQDKGQTELLLYILCSER